MRTRVPDKIKARSMIEAVELEMSFIETMQVTPASAPIIVRSIYENFRMLGDALLAARGKESSGLDQHTQMITELFSLQVSTTRPLQALLNLKDLRHNINYRGYHASVREAQDWLDFATKCYQLVLEAVKKELR